jgi:hypothetical protein
MAPQLARGCALTPRAQVNAEAARITREKAAAEKTAARARALQAQALAQQRRAVRQPAPPALL